MNLPTTIISTTTNVCENCTSPTRWRLHNVYFNRKHFHLCTCCVLHLHSQSFCPLCFQLHGLQPPQILNCISCVRCNSYTHSHCVINPPNLYLCPPCVDPNFKFFDLDMPGLNLRVVDKKLVMVMLCAAQIAAMSMAKAVEEVKIEAETKVREAAVARKEAKEALEHVMDLVVAEKGKKGKEEEGSLNQMIAGIDLNGEAIETGNSESSG